MGGARAYVPKAIRERATVKVLQKKLRPQAASADAAAPAWVQSIFASGGEDAGGSGGGSGGDGRGGSSSSSSSSHGGAAAGSSRGAGAGSSGAASSQQQQQHRFARAEGVAAQREREARERESARQSGAQERARKLKARSAQRSVVRLRTSKGQPLLSARMKGVLSKVERLVGR
jgi:hypothetical protein